MKENEKARDTSSMGVGAVSNRSPLKQSVEMALENYFEQLDGYEATNLYKMVMDEVEQSLFSFTLQQVNGNQCKAASLLGINRGTLRKKLRQYQLIYTEST